MLLRVAVVEDEVLQREQIVAWLVDAGVTVVGAASDGRSAVQLIDETRPDLVLLDVSLPEFSGLDVLQRIEHEPEVVFTTAHRDYAIEAFELGAVDYLLKPFGRDRLTTALDRMLERREGLALPVAARVASVRDSGDPLTRIFVRDRGGIVPILVETIVRLEADGDYTAVVAGGSRFLVAMPLSALHRRIRRPEFIRVHRQHVVNVAHVARFITHDSVRLRVQLGDGTSIVASRAGSQLLRALAE